MAPLNPRVKKRVSAFCVTCHPTEKVVSDISTKFPPAFFRESLARRAAPRNDVQYSKATDVNVNWQQGSTLVHPPFLIFLIF